MREVSVQQNGPRIQGREEKIATAIFELLANSRPHRPRNKIQIPGSCRVFVYGIENLL